MQAIIVNEFGAASQLTLTDLPALNPGEGEVAIAVEAAGVGLVDVLQRQGLLGAKPGFIPGLEVSGRVTAVEPGVDKSLLGRRVFALGTGGYAQQFTARADGLVALPAGLSPTSAVALGVNALVAHFSLQRAQARAGNTVLVRGASGGIGAMVAQMAVRLGAIVTAVTNAGAADQVAALGVQNVVRRGIDPVPTGPFDIIIDPVGGEAVVNLIGALAPNGRYVVNGAAAGFPPADIGATLLQNFTKSPTYSLFSLDSASQEAVLSAASKIFAKVASADIRPLIAAELPLGEAVQAHNLLKSGDRFGKIVLKPS